jgi:DNA polymerase elongation subunit (family B)
MIVYYSQKRDNIDISFINDEGQIEVGNVNIGDDFYRLVECDEYHPLVIPGLKSFKGSNVMKEKAHYFKNHNMNYFIDRDLKNYDAALDLAIKKLNFPNPLSFDIEVLPTDEHGYSSQEDAFNPVTTITVTDQELNSVVFTMNHPKYNTLNGINDIDRGYINNILREQLGDYYEKHEYNYEVKFFETEYELLSSFCENVNKYFHTNIGWNIYDYDVRYLCNRMARIGLSFAKASPRQRLQDKKVDINDNTSIEYKIPSHRIFSDYMMLFKGSQVYSSLGNYSLDGVAEEVLGLHKVSYQGNLRTLYNSDYLRYIAYALTDTILVMLLHKKTSLLNVDLFQSYYNTMAYEMVTQNAISEALVYNQLMMENTVLLDSEHTGNQYRPYPGGYVKDPTKKETGSAIGVDMNSLYPNGIITGGLSPDGKVDSIQVNHDGFPLTNNDKKKWEEYRSQGCALTPTGRIYDVSKETLYVRIEKRLIGERKIFKDAAADVYLNMQKKIDDEKKRRGITTSSH